MTRGGRSLGWLCAVLLVSSVPEFARAQIACEGPKRGPQPYCPDCIYDTFGEFDVSRTPDDFACGQFSRLRVLGVAATPSQWADPFLAEGGPYRLEGVRIRLRRPSELTPIGDVVVRVFDDLDVLGDDDPEDPLSFDDNEPGIVLARAFVAGEAICQGGTGVNYITCDETSVFEENPFLVDGSVYWVAATMNETGGATWVKTNGEDAMLNCTGPNCSDEFKTANSNDEAPTWIPAQGVAAVGLVRLVPEPSASLLGAAALTTLATLAASRGRRRS